MSSKKHVSLREDGPFAVEVYQSLVFVDSPLPTRFIANRLIVVYADSDQPSHSVRIFVHEEA